MGNSLQQLTEIITKLKIAYQSTSTTHAAFYKVFKIEPENLEEVHLSYIELVKLATKCQRILQSLKLNNEQKYLGPIEIILEAIYKIDLSSNGSLSQFNNHIDKETLIRLEYVMDFFPENKLQTDEQLEKLLNDLLQIESDILSLEINPELKALFLYNTNDIANGIKNYRIWGAEILKGKLEKCLGSILLNSSLANSKEETEAARKIVGFISLTDQIISIANNSKQLLEPVFNMFIGAGK
ncbi:hypothetical protein [Paenibacillus ferrarius]|uniref:hypothetical protein n=1 Tax=Paenibacillus ferrarius TaxID=1469647 RepID=UPI003D2E6A72